MQDLASCSHSFYNEYFYMILFILAVLGLFQWGLVSNRGEWGLLCGCGRGLLIARGFPCWGAPALGQAGFSSCGPWAPFLCGMWDLPEPGIEPVSPTLAGGFYITEPPEKPTTNIFEVY